MLRTLRAEPVDHPVDGARVRQCHDQSLQGKTVSLESDGDLFDDAGHIDAEVVERARYAGGLAQCD